MRTAQGHATELAKGYDRQKSSSLSTELDDHQKIAKVGRNDHCPCGSGLKYKNCCGK
ncbi:MAG: SEC-C metal-binding domain-containing protein [Eubacteriales bacterium]|nr:SEC-C metal-binding domain-containing protein [Eubacteriales bacterium]